MKILLSVGIQLAQADISVDQARDLGLIMYLSFLKIKGAQQFVQHQKSNNLPLEETEQCLYKPLCHGIEDFLRELKFEINRSNSISAFINVTKSLESGKELDSKKYSSLKTSLQTIHNEARNFLGTPRDSFMNKIASLQSLASLEKWKAQFSSDAFCPLNSHQEVLNYIAALQPQRPITSNWQVA
ncbi:hypothetical protein [Nonlabens marinus]|uniref:Uncharacterized protein n=1 Tax=Nonlabens marinus S1-08 TaxID=1454201 RepID=W8VNS2_9FLAO|nr:hypothetical protein [Nonlabens marinus]BAO54040.1 hypothetical protein NMS_0031 [Nonlabens marinus S1-08]